MIGPADTAACCSLLTSQPLTMEQAEQVAPLLKALADPVRLRLNSASRAPANASASIMAAGATWCSSNAGVRCSDRVLAPIR